MLCGIVHACSPEQINHPSEAGIPDATLTEPVIEVDQEINQVTFSLPAGTKALIPVWIFQDKTGEWSQYSAQNGLKKIFTVAGDYTVSMQPLNNNRVSPNYVEKTFHIDNSLLNFFYDVPNGAYFYEAVKWAVENGITTGVGNDLFAPEQPCTRAQAVTFLWRAAGSPEPKGAASGMTDVVSGSYYEKAVAWAIENGITTGTTTSTFSPDVTCTRAQAVTFLARALKAKAASAAEFSDVPTDSYFADAVAWAAANGVTEGIGGGLFGSNNDCTRGQIVTFLYRAYNK